MRREAAKITDSSRMRREIDFKVNFIKIAKKKCVLAASNARRRNEPTRQAINIQMRSCVSPSDSLRCVKNAERKTR